MELVDEDGFRCDGRRSNELRQVRCRLDVVPDANGSAYLEHGLTKVLAAVYGPCEAMPSRSRVYSDRASIKCEISVTPFSCSERPVVFKNDRKLQEWTLQLRCCFERVINASLYPHSVIRISCDIIQADGSELSACINAVSLALFNASIAMVDVVTSTTCAFSRQNMVLDMNGQEESMHFVNILVLAITRKKQQLALMESNCQIHADYAERFFELAKEGCSQVYEILDPLMRNHLTKVMASVNIQ